LYARNRAAGVFFLSYWCLGWAWRFDGFFEVLNDSFTAHTVVNLMGY
jgi:hypothetical protein